MILFPPSGFPLWVAAAPAHCEQRGSWEEFGGQECVDCAAVAICIGLCYLWLCIFAQKAPSHFLPTQVWLPLGFSSSLHGCHLTSEHLPCILQGASSHRFNAVSPQPIHSFNTYTLSTYWMSEVVQGPGNSKTNEVQIPPWEAWGLKGKTGGGFISCRLLAIAISS